MSDEPPVNRVTMRLADGRVHESGKPFCFTAAHLEKLADIADLGKETQEFISYSGALADAVGSGAEIPRVIVSGTHPPAPGALSARGRSSPSSLSRPCRSRPASAGRD